MWPTQRLKERVLARRQGVPRAVIDETAFAGILVALLIFMMVAVPSSPHGMLVDLARTDHPKWLPGARREDAVKVTISRDGAIYVGNLAVPPDGLSDELLVRLRDSPDKRVYLQVDARAQYGDVDVVLEAIRAAGVVNVSFVTRQR
jgi:biopolymer transport protein ExbD